MSEAVEEHGKKINVIAGVITAAVLVGFLAIPEPDMCSDHPQAKARAYSIAKDYMEDRLRSPSTASFQSFRSTIVQQGEPCYFHISSYVDAQNGFGATIRTHFALSVRYDQNTGRYYLDEHTN